MAQKTASLDATYFLGFDGGGTKTECVLADATGKIVARFTSGPSNPLRSGYTRAWFSLSEAADAALSRAKLTATDIQGICAGLSGAGRPGVVRRVKTFFETGYPNARVSVKTDLEIALDAAFGADEGIILLAGTGSAAFGRAADGRTARIGGRGPWISDEGSAFDIGRRAVKAVTLADEHRGPETALLKRLYATHHARDWDALAEHIAKNADDVFPRTFPLVAELADHNDAVSRQILADAAAALASLAEAVVAQLGWQEREVPLAKVGGVYGRSKYFDSAIDRELKKSIRHVRMVPLEISPAEAAVRMAMRASGEKGHAA